jgi:hypothetical protein
MSEFCMVLIELEQFLKLGALVRNYDPRFDKQLLN